MPVALLYILVFSIGMGLLLSVMIVFFRDIQHLYGVFLAALNYLTPIFYPYNMLPEWLKKLMIFNPMYNFIQYFREIVLYGQWPTLQENLICAGFALLSLFLGLWYFKKHQDNFILYI